MVIPNGTVPLVRTLVWRLHRSGISVVGIVASNMNLAIELSEELNSSHCSWTHFTTSCHCWTTGEIDRQTHFHFSQDCQALQT